MNDKIDTRQLILNAAMERVLHYGYGKTTMAEIAKDCGMSAGNIYRFFASKIDIAEAMARQYNAEINQSQAALARGPGSAPEKLRRLHEIDLKATFEKLDMDAKILEVAEILAKQRPEFSNEELALERVHLVKILKQGVDEGHFAPMDDPEFVAEMIQSATMKFRYPQLFSALTLPALQRELAGVMDLILAGLQVGAKTPDTVSAE